MVKSSAAGDPKVPLKVQLDLLHTASPGLAPSPSCKEQKQLIFTEFLLQARHWEEASCGVVLFTHNNTMFNLRRENIRLAEFRCLTNEHVKRNRFICVFLYTIKVPFKRWHS